jgi:Holliday junction DNA helicase RuvA
MIASLSGNLREKRPDLAVIDVQGVGYAVQIPLSTFYLLGEIDSRVHLKIHMHVREDALALFGFLTDKERLMFEKLIGISGIGPKLAINILSGAAVDDLAVFLKAGDITRLIRIPGIGKKTAERMVLELRDKVKDLALDPATAPGQSFPLVARERSGRMIFGWSKDSPSYPYIRNGYIRLVAARGAGTLGIHPFRTIAPNVFIIVDKIQMFDPEMYEKGMKIIVASTAFALSTLFPGLFQHS